MDNKQEYMLKTRDMLLEKKENLIKKKQSITVTKNQYCMAIITSSIIIGISILLSGGIYSFESPNIGVVQRYNKFTGVIELCVAPKKEFQCGIKKTN